MRRRLRKKGDLRSSSIPDAYLGYKRIRRAPPAGRVLYVSTYLPRPVAQKARREIYPYPYPNQIQKRGRVIRLALKRPRGRMVKTTVAIRVPRHLPLARASYVSLSRNRLNIHSTTQLRRLEDAQERNRRRYSEHKGNHRKARHGQLDSRGSQRHGSVAEAYRRGGTIDEIADAALVARALSKRR